jgi:hypothetical protein
MCHHLGDYVSNADDHQQLGVDEAHDDEQWRPAT